MKYIGIVLGWATILVLWLVKAGLGARFHDFYNIFFTDILRVVYDNSLGRLSFASVYLIFGFLVFWITKKFYAILVSEYEFKSNFQRVLSISTKFLNFSGWIVFLFYFLWGFNYLRPSRDSSIKCVFC